MSTNRSKKKTKDGWDDDRRKTSRNTKTRIRLPLDKDGQRDHQRKTKGLEEKICVVTWNVNKSFAHYGLYVTWLFAKPM